MKLKKIIKKQGGSIVKSFKKETIKPTMKLVTSTVKTKGDLKEKTVEVIDIEPEKIEETEKKLDLIQDEEVVVNVKDEKKEETEKTTKKKKKSSKKNDVVDEK